MYFILRWLINTGALMLLPYLLKGISVNTFWTALIFALIYGFILAVIRPIIIVLTLPINILSLGLFTLVINALLFWLTSLFVSGFTISGFLYAFLGALIMSVVGIVTGWFVRK